jgi:ribosomal protein S12 methylthiotransferase accessory factor
MATSELVKALVTGKSDLLDGKLVTFNTLNFQTETHIVTQRPQCPACGDTDFTRREPKPIQITSVQKQFRADGGHRAVSPDVTYARYKKHISPISGVVSSLKDLTEKNGDGLTYSYSAGHNFAMMVNDISFLLQNLRGRSGGKGATDIQAKVSAICEAIERYSGVYRGDVFERTASLDSLGDSALHPNDLMLFSESQYANRLEWNRTHAASYHKIPEIFDPHKQLSWTPVWSLSEQKMSYVPSGYCYYGHPELKATFFCTCDANGNAAGNTLNEAILQGFMELVERDSVALWWYSRVQRPRIDLDSFHDDYFNQLREFYRSQGRDVWVIDLTTDLGIPSVAAVSRRIDHPVEDIVLGFGAHFDARIAIMRALTEVNQFMPSVSKRDEQGNTLYWFHDRDAIKWWKTATIDNNPYVSPDPNLPPKTRNDFADSSSNDLSDDVERCVTIAKQHGMNTYVLDQTQPDIGLCVVKVIVPGLRHFWMRFGPGRLYTKPVELGWLQKPLNEAELNPIGIFF